MTELSFSTPSGSTVTHTAPGITVFEDQHGMSWAVYWASMDGLPLSVCRPEQFGYSIVAVEYVDVATSAAVAEVVHTESFIAAIDGWGAW
jgi:hypothetical protein